MRILIAEDDLASRMLLGTTLRQLGHTFTAAVDGQQAWDMFSAESSPLVISDWMMPNRDGLELCRLIRGASSGRYTYVILLTALDGKQHYLEGMKAGADDFLTKPFDRETLAARLAVAARILGLQAEVRQLQELLPICSWCKNVRNDHERWVPLEEYVAEYKGTDISHTICPECLATKFKK